MIDDVPHNQMPAFVPDDKAQLVLVHKHREHTAHCDKSELICAGGGCVHARNGIRYDDVRHGNSKGVGAFFDNLVKFGLVVFAHADAACQAQTVVCIDTCLNKFIK